MIQRPESSSDFQVFTSLRSDSLLTHQDSQSYMLSFHRDRLLAAQKAFHWPVTMFSGPDGLQDLEQCLHEHLASTYDDPLYPKPLKIRILIPLNSTVLIESAPVPPLPLSTLFPSTLTPTPSTPPAWSIYLSSQPIIPTLHTTHKTTLRAPYDHARSLLPLAPPTSPNSPALMLEILLYNPTSEITEGTLTTPYFFRAGTWLTPSARSGGNQGTTRRWALEKGLCVEGVVRREDVMVGEVVWLSNGVRGWGWGKVEVL